MISPYYPLPIEEYEGATEIHEDCPEHLLSQHDIDKWIVYVDPLWSSKEPKSTLKERFSELAQQWGDETGHLSSPNQKMLHPSYQAILGMGQEHREEIIDLLLQDLKDNRRQWFWALSFLAQANPITPADAGRMDRMIDAWVRWGKTRKHA
ncbi:MAG: hypothetical protein ABR956_19115 [Terracidiphilus sp.]